MVKWARNFMSDNRVKRITRYQVDRFYCIFNLFIMRNFMNIYILFGAGGPFQVRFAYWQLFLFFTLLL